MSDETVLQEPEVRTQFNDARQAAEMIPVGGAGVELQNFAQQVDYAKWIAQAGMMIPKHLRGNVGACLAVLDMSQRWGFSPFQVARMTYEVNGNIGLQAQLVHAVLNKFAPLQHRLKIEFEGEGEDRVCIVTGRFRGEADDCVYRSPRFGDISPKNSPLWKTDRDQQHSYLSVTRWSRRFSPGTLMGLFSKEELEDAGAEFIGPDQAKDITPAGKGLHERLMASQHAGSEGFRDGVVEAGLAERPAGEPEASPPSKGTPEPGKHTRKPRTKKSAPSEPAGEASSEAPPPSNPPDGVQEGGGEPESEVMPPESTNQPQPETQPASDHAPVRAPPKTAGEYVAYAERWIAAEKDPANIDARYEGERDMRDELQVPMASRNMLVGLCRDRIAELE